MANATYTLISSQVLGSAVSTVTFSSIPNTYNDLKLMISARGDAASATGQIQMRLNNDTGTNYSYTYILGNSAAASSARSTSNTADTSIIFDEATSTAPTFGSSEIYIPNYNSTSSKPFFGIHVTENNSNSADQADVKAVASLYSGASGISSITLTSSSGNFIANSSFYLYGIKNS